MQTDPQQIRHRLTRILPRLDDQVYPERVALEIGIARYGTDVVPAGDAIAGNFEPGALGLAWGAPWSTTWFRLRGEVPREWRGRTVHAVVDFGANATEPGFQAEALVYAPDGSIHKGLNPRNGYVPINDPGSPVELYVEAAANPGLPGWDATPLGDPGTAGAQPLYHLSRAELAVFDAEAWHLAGEVRLLADLAAQLPQDQPRYWQVLHAVRRCLDVLDVHRVADTAHAARAELRGVLAAPAAASAHRISAIGHAHIDTAWLWPLRETVRKVARTTANVLALMDEYPELLFAGPQAQQYVFLQEHYPALFARVAKQVAAGRWLPVGGMWVEADGNLPGGEALARQLVYGKRYFLQTFDVECREVWLPDSFGYTAAFPQLARLAGFRWFLTQKLSWSETNRMPHHTFRWEGIDGSRVFTHFPPVDTYNSMLSPAELAHAVRNFADKDRATRSLVPFGYGDGGGGPTREMLADARRQADLDGSPVVRLESPADFFAAAEDEYPDAPVWYGELYLETHRGTFTNQQRIKEGNRRCERLLREAELWAATAAVATGAGYPYRALERLWRTVLLHQFHDILPGSSIAWVNREAVTALQGAAGELEGLIRDSLAALAGADSGPGGDGNPGPDGAGSGSGGPVAVNASPLPRAEVWDAPGGPGWVAAPGFGTAAVRTALPDGVAPARASVRGAAGDDVTELSNGLVTVQIDATGRITSLIDHGTGRDCILPGGYGNHLVMYPDHPALFDAWNLDAGYDGAAPQHLTGSRVDLVDDGPLLARLSIAGRIGGSDVRQTVTLYAGVRGVDIDTTVDWRETERVLKLGFDLDVAADRAAAEIQFGHVYRATHTNTSWDKARFEVYAHRYVHVAEPRFGVVLANRTTYGHDIARIPRDAGGAGTRIRATLLRGARFPDPGADAGEHRFAHRLAPAPTIAEAVAHGYAVNQPLRPAAGTGQVAPLVGTDDPAVIAEAVKLADDGSGDLVVRVYESLGTRVDTGLRVNAPFRACWVTDLLERKLDAPSVVDTQPAGARIPVSLRPFEVRTYRFSLDGAPVHLARVPAE